MSARKIEPPTRRKWLERQENGESVRSIASTEKCDVRTVQKHLQLAEEERNRREAMTAFVRTALERHQADLLDVVRAIRRIMPVFPDPSRLGAELETEIGDPISLPSKLLEALRKEHIPKADLWKAIRKWEVLRDSYRAAERERDKERVDALSHQLLIQGERVRDELDTIILRGLVPGHCRYCPV